MSKQRICPDCGADISHRSPCAKRCVECAAEYKRACARRSRLEATKMHTPRLCLDCGVDISERQKSAKRCLDCAKKRCAKLSAERNRQVRALGTACAVCGKRTGGPTAVYCPECRRLQHGGNAKKVPLKPAIGLNEAAKQAKELGLSYGYWAAIRT